MSKTTKQGTSSTIYVNGVPKAYSSTNSKGEIEGGYFMSPWEKEAYDYSQKSFAENLPDVNVFSDETRKNLNKQIDAYKAKGIDEIDDIYAPILRNLQNDIASRFGNLDNSIFLDKLSKIEDKRADSVNALAQDIVTQGQDIIQNELQNRYDYLNFLNDYQNQINQNILGMTNTSKNMLNNTSVNQDSALTNELNNQAVKKILNMLIGTVATENSPWF